MKKEQPRLRRSLDADNEIRFNQQEIQRLLKKAAAEEMRKVDLLRSVGVPAGPIHSVTIDLAKVQASPKK